MKYEKIIGICIVFLLLMPFSLSSTYKETASVSRIVGESPTEMLRQMQRDSLDLDYATYYSNDNINLKKRNILKEQFDSNLDTNFLFTEFDFNQVDDEVNNFQKNEFFILETNGDVEPLYAKTPLDTLYPVDVKQWQEKFELTNPLFLFESPYAGIYLPKEDTFVSRLVRDSTIVAPASYNSPQFTRAFLCELWDGKTIGQVFMDARNFHYNGGSKSNQNNYIGLVLQSYSLYGNPMQQINMDFSEQDRLNLKKRYCKNYLENLAEGVEYLGPAGNYSKFRKHIVFEIPSYNIEEYGDYHVINATNTYQNMEYGELVLPMAVRTTHFPANTMILDYGIDSVTNYVDLTVVDLPAFDGDVSERACYYDEGPYDISFQNSYSETQQDFIATIHPVEVLNCTEGSFRMYQKFEYHVDYIPMSPVLIDEINSPLSKRIDEKIDVNISLMEITTNVESGTLAIFGENNNVLWEKDIQTDETEHSASFYAPEYEGLQKYSVEFIQDGETMHYDSFEVFITIVEPRADIPVTTPLSPSINVDIYSFLDSSFALEGKYYLNHGNDLISDGSFTKTISKGSNVETFSFSGLTREDQSYTLTLELDYLEQEKKITYLLNTNNVPLIYSPSYISVEEGYEAVINYSVVDYDGDSLIVGINDSRFTKQSNKFIWQTEIGDEGEFVVMLRATDPWVTGRRAVLVEVTPDACKDVVCDDYCDGYTLYSSGSCSEGLCVYDVVEENSTECGWTEGNCDCDSDCGTDDWVSGTRVCSGDEVWQDWRTYTCNNPGTPESSCSYSDNSEFFKTCTFGCSNGYCLSDSLNIKMDVDTITVDHNWKKVTLDNSYNKPVVIASVPSYNGRNPVVTRIKNVNSNSFYIRVQEDSGRNDIHDNLEKVSYFVIESGRYDLPDGGKLEARQYFMDTTTRNGWKKIDFTNSYSSKPVVLSQIMSYNGENFVMMRTKEVSTSGAYIAMQEEEVKDNKHYSEYIGVVVFEPGTGKIENHIYEVKKNSISDINSFTKTNFVNSYENNPYFVASIQTFNGENPAHLRYKTLTNSYITLACEEDVSHDDELNHYTELVGYLVLSDLDGTSEGGETDCISHSYKKCYNDDVYWYDSCNKVEDIFENCNSGEGYWKEEEYCENGDIWDIWVDNGCADDSCYIEEKEKIKAYGLC